MTPETTESAEETHSTKRPRVRVGPLAFALFALVLVTLGIQIIYRVWLLGHARPSSDEGVVALEATGILHGQFHAFFWGQNYGESSPGSPQCSLPFFPTTPPSSISRLSVLGVP
ncbi:MAG: hypothetical protein WCG59_09630, partial [Actinomycetes bacterium]